MHKPVMLSFLLPSFAMVLACSGMFEAPAPVEVPLEVIAEPEPDPEPIELAFSRDPAALAARLAEVEGKVRDPAVDDETAGRWGHLQQRIYRALGEDSVLAGAVLDKVPAELKSAVGRCIHGTTAIGKTVTKPKTDLPDWRIVEPKPASELMGYYKESSAKHGVPWTILASIHLNETRLGRLRGLSDVGATGPMQFMPQTWADYGEGDIESDRDAIMAAGHYLSKMGWATDERKAIWAYNHSNQYVDAIQDFAAVMDENELAFRGLWGWQVYYRTIQGSIWLEAGYDQPERITIEAYCQPRGEPHCPAIH